MNSLYLNVITHLHTYASSGPASSLDSLAKSMLSEVFGTIPENFVWRECFTGVDDIRQIMERKRTKNPVDILFLTDHMSSRQHVLDKGLLRLATEDRRIGLGAEIQTVCFSEKQGRFVTSPEVLLYGSSIDQEFEGRKYSGIDNAIINDLYRECTTSESVEPIITKVNTFCRRNNIACALAHPFDCQQLDLDETLDVIALFLFVEAVNGGFPHRSARALQQYVAFHNELLGNGLLSDSSLTEAERRRIKTISQSEILVPLGGSDAHLNHFDRVVTRFRTVSGKTLAADFIKVMLECSTSEIMRKNIMVPAGRGCSMTGLYKDVLGIAYKNIYTYRSHFRNPRIWPGLIRTLMTTGYKELKVRIKRNKSIATDYRTQISMTDMHQRITRRRAKHSQSQAHNCV